MPPFDWTIGWAVAIWLGLLFFTGSIWVAACYVSDYKQRRSRATAEEPRAANPSRVLPKTASRPTKPLTIARRDVSNIVPMRRPYDHELDEAVVYMSDHRRKR